MKIKTINGYFISIFLMISGIWIIIITNQMNKQSTEIQILKQNNAEQIEEKEYYINYSQKLENLLIDSGLVDECDCN